MKKMFFLMLTFLIMGAASMNAQVTIGSDNLPHSGAVLDLQSDNLGLKLPNVALNANLTEFVLPLTAPSTKEDAKGMYVYNTNATIGEGVYVWDGYQWILVKASIGEKPAESFLISSANGSVVLAPGGTLQFSAYAITPDDADTPQIQWSIDRGSGFAIVTVDGLVTGRAPGTVTLVATAGAIKQTATLHIAYPATQLPVRQWVGSHEYDTYDFGGTVWMIQNSHEGNNASAVNFDDDPEKTNGYYYTKSQAIDHSGDGPCSGDWYLPTMEEARALSLYLSKSDYDDVKYWLGANNWAGYRGSYWSGWQQNGYWRTEAEANIYIGTGPNRNFVTQGGSTSNLMSVRCVKR
jgi:uncharacterized protein (TIGR02145 family)